MAESGRATYPEDDTEGVLMKLFVLPLFSALFSRFFCGQSAPAPAPALAPPPAPLPLPVLGLECRWVFLVHPVKVPSHGLLPSGSRSRLLLLDPHAPGLLFPPLSSLGEPSGNEPRLLLLLLCSDSRLSACGSHSKSVSGK